MVERQLPKLHTGVRFPSPAHLPTKRAKDERHENETLYMTAKKGGEVMAQGLIVVSADGKSQEVNLTSPRRCDERLQGKSDGKDDRKSEGERFRTKAVYDKE